MTDVKTYVRGVKEKINNAKPTTWITDGLSDNDINEAILSAILTELKLARVSDTHIKSAISIAENALKSYKENGNNEQ